MLTIVGAHAAEVCSAAHILVFMSVVDDVTHGIRQ